MYTTKKKKKGCFTRGKTDINGSRMYDETKHIYEDKKIKTE
jgi:hypothetical protein